MNEYIIQLCDGETGKPVGTTVAWGQDEHHAMVMAMTRYPDAIAVYLRPDGSLGALVPIWDLSGGQSLTPVVLAAETP